MLEIDGNPAGAIYLERGQITVAQASWVPDLTARLRGVLSPASGVRALLAAGDQADRDVGTALLRLGHLTRNQLQAVLRSVVVDAVIALTVPLAGEATVSGVRFEAPRAHWAGAFSRLRVESVRTEAIGRAERMARFRAALTTPVALCDLERGPAVVTREQWAIAGAVDGTESARGLAWRCGVAFYDTVECVAALVRAGLCTLCPAEEAAVPDDETGQPGPDPAGAGPIRVPPPLPALLPAPVLREALLREAALRDAVPPQQIRPRQALPRRRPQGSAPGPSPEGPGVPGEADYSPPPPEVLTRVLDALRRL